ncbi:hypothetical protein L9Z17_20830 [Leptospira noguchii]|nr:hypothetical protein [Leptospira noguchii]
MPCVISIRYVSRSLYQHESVEIVELILLYTIIGTIAGWFVLQSSVSPYGF